MWHEVYSWQTPKRKFTTEEACRKAFTEDRDGVSETALAQANSATDKLAALIGELHACGVLSDAVVTKLLDGHFERAE